jgi:hypothetical protein
LNVFFVFVFPRLFFVLATTVRFLSLSTSKIHNQQIKNTSPPLPSPLVHPQPACLPREATRS